RESGELAKASEAVQQWSTLEPDSLPAASLETQMLLAAGEVERAIATILQWCAGKEDPTQSQAVITLATLLHSSGEHERCVRVLDDYLQRRPKDLRVLLERGSIAVRDKDEPRAQAIEETLRKSDGAPDWMWQSLRVQRLFGQSPTIQSPIFRELITLVDELK